MHALLRNSRSDTEKESHRKQGLASQFNKFKVEILGEKDAWEETKTDLVNVLKDSRAELTILKNSKSDEVDVRFDSSDKLKTHTHGPEAERRTVDTYAIEQ